MRFEAKHRYFKQTAKVLGNFKNIAKTLASRHQRYMCYVLSSTDRFLLDDLEMGPSKLFPLSHTCTCTDVETTVIFHLSQASVSVIIGVSV